MLPRGELSAADALAVQQLRSSNPLLLLLKRLVNEQLNDGGCERPADALFAAVPRFGPMGRGLARRMYQANTRE